MAESFFIYFIFARRALLPCADRCIVAQNVPEPVCARAPKEPAAHHSPRWQWEQQQQLFSAHQVIYTFPPAPYIT